jgi:hypothetical protein
VDRNGEPQATILQDMQLWLVQAEKLNTVIHFKKRSPMREAIAIGCAFVVLPLFCHFVSVLINQ